MLSCLHTSAVRIGLVAAMAVVAVSQATALENDPRRVAELLTRADVWIMPQPKAIVGGGQGFDLAGCQGICLAGEAGEDANCAGSLPSLLRQSSGVSLRFAAGQPKARQIVLGVFPGGKPAAGFPKATAADLKDLGEQGYWLSIDPDAIAAAATSKVGLYYAVRTIAQIATDRTRLPGVTIRDWPSLRYRGALEDVSRGQMPRLGTLKRLADVIAIAKMNIFELYIEHLYKWKKYPDIAPPEGISAEEGRELFRHAAGKNIEVHPMLQVLGHSYGILSKPRYQHLRVGPCRKEPWIMTFDIRKPEAVSLVLDLVREVCDTFPGKFLNVDITEIDLDGFKASGTSEEQISELTYRYLLKLREAIKPHGTRLMAAQGPLSSTGALNGLRPVLGRLPKEIVISSYYTVPPGPYGTAWATDFPLLKKQGRDFFVMPWIESHIRIMPDVSRAADFSDAEVRKGQEFHALGSVTDDWGDDGHYHLVGQTWYPFLYHGVCDWTGGRLDRRYFHQAFCRLLYGMKNDRIATAIHLIGDINSQKIKCRDDQGRIVEKPSQHYWEFWHDPFTATDIVSMADPIATGNEILVPAERALAMLQESAKEASRNRDHVEQLIFAAKNYAAMGRKLIAAGHWRDAKYPRRKVAEELKQIVAVYEQLRNDFRRLWLAEDCENDGFRVLLNRFDETIVPCRQKATELFK